MVARREKEAGTDYYPGRAIQVQVQRIIQVRPAIIIQQEQPVATKPAGPMLVTALGSKHKTNSFSDIANDIPCQPEAKLVDLSANHASRKEEMALCNCIVNTHGG